MANLVSGFEAGFNLLLGAFKNPSFAYEIAASGVGLAVLLVIIATVRARMSVALVRKRISVLEKAFQADKDDPRRGFIASWQDIDKTMLDRSASSWSSTAKRLRVAWEEFRETLVDLGTPEIRSTQRPQEFFSASVQAPDWLDFCANLFVGAGLLLTFAGLVAALKEASNGLESSDPRATQEALTHLLAVASTKFITSIVGVFLSIVLKIIDRLLERWVNGSVIRLCSLIEQGLHHITPQGLAAEQLSELRQQTVQLKSFATELAVAISDRLNTSMSQAMAPVVNSITSLAEAMDRSRAEQDKALREAVGSAISGAASGELKELSAVLSGVSSTLANVQSVVSDSSEAAARQILQAADQFAGVCEKMNSSFDDLTGRISSLGEPLSNSVRDTLLRTMEQIHDAAKSSAEDISRGAADTITHAASVAGDAMTEVGERITASLNQIVNQAERAGEAFGRIDSNLSSHAVSLAAISETSSSALDELRKILRSTESATQTTLQSINTLREVVAQFEEGSVGAKKSIDQVGTLLKQLEGQQTLVNETWEQYRGYFQGVDTQLGAALQGLANHQRDVVQLIAGHVNGLDKTMGSAVNRLRDVVQPLSDLAEELADRRSAAEME